MATVKKLSDFYQNSTKKFRVLVAVNGEAQDIRNDTVAIIMKTNKDDPDDQAVLAKDADVTTEGESGSAIFDITDEDIEDVVAGNYYYEIYWDTGGGEKYVLINNEVKVLERVKKYST